MDTTEHDLKLLSIGYYVQGGVVTFYSFLGLCYVGFMGAIVFKAIHDSAQNGVADQVPSWVLPVIGAVVATFILVILVSGLLLLYAGLTLRRRRHRTFLLVMAALNCMAVPYGTLLGIFTFIVLNRPSAKALFAGLPAIPPPLPR